MDKVYLAQKLLLPGTSGTPIEIKGPEGKNGLFAEDFTLATIINKALPLLFSIAGLFVFVYFIWGGFKLLTSLGDEQKKEAAKGMLTHAVIGFIIIFISYWLTILFGKLFGITIF